MCHPDSVSAAATTSTMTITETTSTTGELGRRQPEGLSVGQAVQRGHSSSRGERGGVGTGRSSGIRHSGFAGPGLGVLQLLLHPLLPPRRLFEYRGRVSPVPRVVPVKRPRVTIPLVRRVKATLPVKLFSRSAAIANSSAKLKREYVRAARGRAVPPSTVPSLQPGTCRAGCSQGKTLKTPKHLQQKPSEGFSEACGLQMGQGKVQGIILQ